MSNCKADSVHDDGALKKFRIPSH